MLSDWREAKPKWSMGILSRGKLQPRLSGTLGQHRVQSTCSRPLTTTHRREKTDQIEYDERALNGLAFSYDAKICAP